MSYDYTLFTIEQDLTVITDSGLPETNVSHHPEEAWPAVLEHMAGGFKNFPMVRELWLRKTVGELGMNDTVLLWRRS